MAKEVATHIEINASVGAVWNELINFNAYPSWNPFIQYINGNLTPGSRLSVSIHPPNKKAMRFNPIVQVLEEKKKFVWLGHLIITGIFDGEHSFELIPISENQTHFIHKEKFSGLLVPLVTSMLDKETRQGFINMNTALKARCEAKH